MEDGRASSIVTPFNGAFQTLAAIEHCRSPLQAPSGSHRRGELPLSRSKNGHAMHIRAMTSLDIPRSTELWQACKGVGLGDGDTPEQLEAFLNRNPMTSSVALSEERLIGAVLAGHDGRRGFLYHLAVHPDFRARGLGRALAERPLAQE